MLEINPYPKNRRASEHARDPKNRRASEHARERMHRS